MTADASGIYVIGNIPASKSQGRAGIRKYDTRGNELWLREFIVPVPTGQQFARAAADNTGVYIVEWARQSLRKISPEGDELWSRQLEFRPLGGVVVTPQVFMWQGETSRPALPNPI